MHKGLGYFQGAIREYKQFLQMDDGSLPALSEEAMRSIPELTKRLEQRQAEAAETEQEEVQPILGPPSRPHPKLHRAGWALLGLGYGSALVLGVVMGIYWSDPLRTTNVDTITAWSLLVPVAGPVLSVSTMPTAARVPITGETTSLSAPVYNSLVFSVPVLLVSGGLQVAGLSLVLTASQPAYRERLSSP